MSKSLSILPLDIFREITNFLPPVDFVQFSTVSLSVRYKIGIDVEKITFCHKVIREVQALLPASCPSFRPESCFVIAGSFAAFLAAMHLGVPKSHVNFVYNDVDVFYQVYPDQFDYSGSDDWTSNYARSHREKVFVDGHKIEINWIPGACSGQRYRPFHKQVEKEATDFTVKDVVDSFDLSCVRVGFQVGTLHQKPFFRYICPQFYNFLESRMIKLCIRLTDTYAQRSSAIRMCYKAMVLKAKGFTADRGWLLGAGKKRLEEGDISQANGMKLLALRKANEPMPAWFKGLRMDKYRDMSPSSRHTYSYTLVATSETTFWGAVV